MEEHDDGSPAAFSGVTPTTDDLSAGSPEGSHSRGATSPDISPGGPSPAGGDGDSEFEFHTGQGSPTGKPDAIEFVGVHKSFGSNHVLQGLNMGLPEGQISIILGPSR